MLKHKKFIFNLILFLIIFFLLSVSTWLGYLLYRVWIDRNVLGASFITTLSKENYISRPSDKLIYFYEPEPKIEIHESRSWLTQPILSTINSDSLNERYEYSIEKPSNIFRIVALGDSFTFGAYVNTKDNWVEKLEDMLRSSCDNEHHNFEVLNLGVGGYDVEYIAHRYDLRGRKYNPDLIVWFESGSGFSRLKERLEPLIRKYSATLTNEEKTLEEKKGDYYLAWTKAEKELESRYTPEQISAFVQIAWERFLSSKGDVPLVIATNPLIDYHSNQLLRWTQHAVNTRIFSGVRKLKENGGVLLDGHPNEHGHQMVATDIYTYLKQNRIIPCD